MMLSSRLTRVAVALLKTAGLQVQGRTSPSGNAVEENNSKSEELREYFLNLYIIITI